MKTSRVIFFLWAPLWIPLFIIYFILLCLVWIGERADRFADWINDQNYPWKISR